MARDDIHGEYDKVQEKKMKNMEAVPDFDTISELIGGGVETDLYGRGPQQIEETTQLLGEWNNLISSYSEKGQINTDKIMELQLFANKYVYGDNVLDVDGVMGPMTLKAIRDGNQNTKQWFAEFMTHENHPPKFIDPLRIYNRWVEKTQLKQIKSMMDEPTF